MGDAAGELTDGLHLLGLAKLGFGLFPLVGFPSQRGVLGVHLRRVASGLETDHDRKRHRDQQRGDDDPGQHLALPGLISASRVRGPALGIFERRAFRP